MKRRLYIGAFLLISLIPSLGLLIPGSRDGEEKSSQTLSAVPVLKDENGLNRDFLQDAGAWFADHAAYRS